MILTSQILYPSSPLRNDALESIHQRGKNLTNCKSNNDKNSNKNYICVNRQKEGGELPGVQITDFPLPTPLSSSIKENDKIDSSSRNGSNGNLYSESGRIFPLALVGVSQILNLAH